MLGLYELLKGTTFNVIPLIPSIFVHIGTTPEYAEHLSVNLPNFGFERFVASQKIKKSSSGSHQLTNPIVPPSPPPQNDESCIMYTILTDEGSYLNFEAVGV